MGRNNICGASRGTAAMTVPRWFGRDRSSRPSVWRGFTLVELLVVVAIIAVLLAVMMPSLNRIREQARRSTCASHVRQQLLALHAYGAENHGMLPVGLGGYGMDGAVDCVTVNTLLRSGMSREMFYCPSNSVHRRYNDDFWIQGNPEENLPGWNGSRFTQYSYQPALGSEVTFSIHCSYSWLVYRHHVGGLDIELTPYAKDSTRKTLVKSLQDRAPAGKELVVDKILGAQGSLQPEEVRHGWNFIADGRTWAGKQDQDTNHLRNSYPTGANVGFLDGHGQWRRFDPEIDPNDIAVPRYRTGGRVEVGYFW